MDFIERWLHISPDGGNGTTELLYILALALGILLVAARRPLGKLIRQLLDRLGRN
ncbi:MAG TPA: hypothetical protein VGO11_11210 [Chthoniobacteraceae bacterium]|jgi:hypothetical protein|nr:hypothetical protein [Chthoniobacteraceae bacterium]